MALVNGITREHAGVPVNVTPAAAGNTTTPHLPQPISLPSPDHSPVIIMTDSRCD